MHSAKFSAGCLVFLASTAFAGASRPANLVRFDGARWSLKGEGVVCCPCTTPCPCRNNGQPSFGHCEATLYLRIREGYYGSLSLAGMQVVDSGGMCAIDYHNVSALYFDRSSTPAQQSAYMKIIASLSPARVASFPQVRVVSLNTRVIGNHLFKVFIPGILEMIVDRNWGLASAPMPWVAAQDDFSNMLQYAENIRYAMHDGTANLNFDYSRRQANYRRVDLTVRQYLSESMLIQFADGKGWFSPGQMKLIKAQHLRIPDLGVIQKEAVHLEEAH